MNIESVRHACTAVTLAGAIIIISLERIMPYDKGQKFLREGFFNDFVFYTFIQSFVLGIIISYIIEFIDKSTHLSRLQLVSDWPVWVQIIFFLIVHDLYIYLFHKLQHRNKYLWRIHEAHHTNRQIDWLAGSRSHALEILINQTIEFAPIILLGAAPETAVIKGTIDAVWGMYIHSNIDVKSGKLQLLINGPEMHRWHHSDGSDKAYNKNFSTKLAVWDWLFGTAYLPSNQKPVKYGLSEIEYPKNYFKQIFHAFRKF